MRTEDNARVKNAFSTGPTRTADTSQGRLSDLTAIFVLSMAVFLSLFKPRVFWLYIGICLSGTLIVAFAAQFLLG